MTFLGEGGYFYNYFNKLKFFILLVSKFILVSRYKSS